MSIMNARTNLMSDAYLKGYINTLTKRVRELNSMYMDNNSVIGSPIDSLLVYSESDFLRIADLFNLKIAKDELPEGFSCRYLFKVSYGGVEFQTFTDEELI